MGIRPPDLRPDRRPRDRAAVDRLPREHLRYKRHDRADEKHSAAREDAAELASVAGAAAARQDLHGVKRRQQREQQVLPAHERHDAGEHPEQRPRPQRAPLPGRRPHPGEARDRRHGRGVGHAGFLHQVPGHERPGDGERHGGPGELRRKEETRQPVGEPASEQPVKEARDAGGLPVRIGRAVGADVEPLRVKPGRDDVAGGEKRRPPDRRPDRPRALRVAGLRRLEQVGLVAEAEHPVVVREIDVPVEGHRSKVGEVVEAVALEPRAELQLQGESDGEERAQDQPRGTPAFRGDDGDRRGDDREGDQRAHRRPYSEHGVDERTTRHLPSREIDRGDSHDNPGATAYGARRARRRTCLSRTAQGFTFRMRSSEPGWSLVGLNRATSYVSAKSRW